MTGSEQSRELLRGLPVFAGPLPGFDVESAPDSPTALYIEWLAAAIEAGVVEPHAMTLSTVDADGNPNSRVLILKGIDGDAWQVATSAMSVKGRELAAHPVAALAVYWPTLGRQVRVRGTVSTAGPGVSRADFLARGLAARAEALLGRQSRDLVDPATARADHAAALARVEADPQLVAEHWTVYQIVADEVEFFQASPDRWHTRLQYRRTEQGWARRLLWP